MSFMAQNDALLAELDEVGELGAEHERRYRELVERRKDIARRAYAAGLTRPAICEKLGISKPTLATLLEGSGIPKRQMRTGREF